MGDYKEYWDNICQIYFLTKHYLLLAEELSNEFDTFLQPLKEHRDAFDHVARVYGYRFLQNNDITNTDEYCSANMRKAVGHVYRAFFDTADWLSYICRQKIRLLIGDKKREEIVAKYPEYDELRRKLELIPEKVADIRQNKDVSDDSATLVKEVKEYRLILDDLLAMRTTLSEIF